MVLVGCWGGVSYPVGRLWFVVVSGLGKSFCEGLSLAQLFGMVCDDVVAEV